MQQGVLEGQGGMAAITGSGDQQIIDIVPRRRAG